MRPGPRRVLVPTDFSAGSRAALRQLEWLIPSGSRVDVLLIHVLEPAVSALPIWMDSPDERRQWRARVREDERRAGEALERTASGLAKVLGSSAKITGHVRSGVPYDEICRAADRMRADLIVIGTHGTTGLKRFLLGSVAERVLRHAGRPVLAVPLAARRRRRGGG